MAIPWSIWDNFWCFGSIFRGRLVLVSFVKYVCLCACFCLGGHFTTSFRGFPMPFCLQDQNLGTWLLLHASTLLGGSSHLLSNPYL